MTTPTPASRSVLQDWVLTLGLRHQGVLLTAVRGCDTAPKNDPSKLFTRMLRGAFLNCHCGDAAKAATFIESPWTELSLQESLALEQPRRSLNVLHQRFTAFRKDWEHYPHHYCGHIKHAIEIIGYKHPDLELRKMFRDFYFLLCRGLHVNPETEQQLDERLNADEAQFAVLDRA